MVFIQISLTQFLHDGTHPQVGKITFCTSSGHVLPYSESLFCYAIKIKCCGSKCLSSRVGIRNHSSTFPFNKIQVLVRIYLSNFSDPSKVPMDKKKKRLFETLSRQNKITIKFQEIILLCFFTCSNFKMCFSLCTMHQILPLDLNMKFIMTYLSNKTTFPLSQEKIQEIILNDKNFTLYIVIHYKMFLCSICLKQKGYMSFVFCLF